MFTIMVNKTRIVIRCREDTKKRFKNFCKNMRMDYEEALNYLLDSEERKIRITRY